MKLLLILSFLLFAFKDVFGGKCTNSAPFLKYVKYGYDLAEFDIYGCPYIGGRRAAIADYSDCNNGNKLVMRDEAKTEYELPDGFSTISFTGFTSLSSGDKDDSFDVFIEKHVERRVFNVFKNRIRNAEKYYFRKSEFYKDIRKMFDTGHAVGIVPYNVENLNALPNNLAYKWNRNFISKEFLKDANALPNNFTGNEEQYFEFIKKYGTHHMLTGSFGGIIHRITKLKHSLNDKEKTDIFREVGRDAYMLDKDVQVKCEKINGSRRIQKVLDLKRKFTQIMIGGFADHKLFSNESIPLEYIERNPALVSAQMQPNVILISEEENEKRESLATAIKIHLIRSANEAYVNIINDYATKVTPDESTTQTLNKYQQNIGNFNEIELEELHNEIKKALNHIALKLY